MKRMWVTGRRVSTRLYKPVRILWNGAVRLRLPLYPQTQVWVLEHFRVPASPWPHTKETWYSTTLLSLLSMPNWVFWVSPTPIATTPRSNNLEISRTGGATSSSAALEDSTPRVSRTYNMRLAQLRLHRVQSYNTRLAQLRLCRVGSYTTRVAQLRLCRVVCIVRGSLNYACVAWDRILPLSLDSARVVQVV